MIKTDAEFLSVAMRNYDNPACVDIKEFQSDIKRFASLNRHLSDTNDWTPEVYRKTLNQLLIIYNIFGVSSNSLLHYKIFPWVLPKIISLSVKLNRYTEELGNKELLDERFLEELHVNCK